MHIAAVRARHPDQNAKKKAGESRSANNTSRSSKCHALDRAHKRQRGRGAGGAGAAAAAGTARRRQVQRAAEKLQVSGRAIGVQQQVGRRSGAVLTSVRPPQIQVQVMTQISCASENKAHSLIPFVGNLE